MTFYDIFTYLCTFTIIIPLTDTFGVIFHPHEQSTEFYPESMIAQLIFLVIADIILYKPARKYLGWMVTNLHNAMICMFTFP